MTSIYDKSILKKIKQSTVEPKTMYEKRQLGFQLFKKLPLPSQKSEGWKYTDIKDLNLNEFLPGKQKVEFIGQNKELEKKGVIFTDIRTALEKHFDIIKECLPMSLVSYKEDKFTAMHAAFWNEGVFIYLPKNIKLELPLRNRFYISRKGGFFNHALIILEQNSSLKYIEEHVSEEGDYVALRSDVVEIYAKENSSLDFHNLQNWVDNVINFSNWSANLERNSKVNWFFGQFGGKISRVKIDSFFNGPGSESHNCGVFYGNKNQHFDITTNAHHIEPHTTGNIIVKGVLDNHSTSVYRGKIKIDKTAQDTNSYLSDHSLILSEHAVSNSVPTLEIDANEVSASHSATLGRPDEEEIFYLMSRGLSRKEAEKLIILGFFSEITEKIEIDDLRLGFEKSLQKKYFR